MWSFIWLGLMTIIVLGIVIFAKYEKKKHEGFEDSDAKKSELPNSYTVDIVNSTKVSQPPFPPCVGFVDEVVYAPTDINADIGKIKADLANLQKNIPNYVTDGINQQTGKLVKGILRQQGIPLTDDQYGLNCN
jgi:hypothetical protein